MPTEFRVLNQNVELDDSLTEKYVRDVVAKQLH